MSWIIDNLGTIVVGLLLAAVVTAITIRLVKNKKAGKNSCGCGCQGCAMAGACHSGNKKEMEAMEEEIIRRIHESNSQH